MPEVSLPIHETADHRLRSDAYDVWLAEYLARDRAREFDLSHAPLMRVAVLPGHQAGPVCVWSFHRLILDERSAVLVLREVLAWYDAFQRNEHPTPATPVPYSAYLDWLSERSTAGAHTYWRGRLAGLGAPRP